MRERNVIEKKVMEHLEYVVVENAYHVFLRKENYATSSALTYIECGKQLRKVMNMKLQGMRGNIFLEKEIHKPSRNFCKKDNNKT